jgi:hypothetical protein
MRRARSEGPLQAGSGRRDQEFHRPETLRLEPRHFGAVSGFAQICLRRGYLEEARASFQMALRINPHLQGVGDIIEALGRSMDRPH